MQLSLFFFLGGLFVSLLTTPFLIKLASKGVGLDKPDGHRKQHTGKISRLGGIPLAVVFGSALGLLLAFSPRLDNEWITIGLTSGLIFSVGLRDDFKPLGAKFKLAAQILIASIAYTLGATIDQITYPGGLFTIHLGSWSLILTVFWLIAVPNIVNLIDGADGLAGGLGAFLFGTLGIVAIQSQQWEVAWISFAMVGALLGFLVFNFPPAKIFLGDGGAYLIGFCVAILSLKSSNKGSIAAALLVVLIALGVPIADTVFALLRRGLKGYPLFHADSGHIHHRLINKMGLSKQRVIWSLYAITVILSLMGLSIFWSQGRTLPIAFGVFFLMALYAFRYLTQFNTWEHFQLHLRRVLHRRRDVQYAILLLQLLEMELERNSNKEEFWAFFHSMLERIGFYRQPLDTSGEWHRIEVPIPHRTHWILYVRCHQHDCEEWLHLAETFRHLYSKALLHWE